MTSLSKVTTVLLLTFDLRKRCARLALVIPGPECF